MHLNEKLEEFVAARVKAESRGRQRPRLLSRAAMIHSVPLAGVPNR